jgi:hypothetical protein
MEVNIKLNLKEAVWEDVEWIQVAQDRIQLRVCEYGNEPSASIKDRGIFLKVTSFTATTSIAQTNNTRKSASLC